MVKNQQGRYSIDYLAETEFEPGSRKRVLRNFLGIKRKREIDILEWEALQNTIAHAIQNYSVSHRFTIPDIIKLHKMWLGKIYPWAGQYRQVNMSKDGFYFAAANQIKKLMTQFERKYLEKYTPCNLQTLGEIAKAIAIIHTELILIHPFRDGNGRVARLLANLMALQAGLPLLDFSQLKGQKKQGYFSAVQAGMEEDYTPMTQVFTAEIKRAIKHSLALAKRNVYEK